MYRRLSVNLSVVQLSVVNVPPIRHPKVPADDVQVAAVNVADAVGRGDTTCAAHGLKKRRNGEKEKEGVGEGVGEGREGRNGVNGEKKTSRS